MFGTTLKTFSPTGVLDPPALPTLPAPFWPLSRRDGRNRPTGAVSEPVLSVLRHLLSLPGGFRRRFQSSLRRVSGRFAVGDPAQNVCAGRRGAVHLPPCLRAMRLESHLTKIIRVAKCIDRVGLVPPAAPLPLLESSHVPAGLHPAFGLKPSRAGLVALRPCLLPARRDQLHRARLVELQAAAVDPAMSDQRVEHRLAGDVAILMGGPSM